MLSVLLTIGKGLAILILALFLLLLFLMGLVLFVPLRYRANAEKSDSIRAFCRLSWLFSIVSLSVAYEDGKACAQIRIFGFLWRRRKKKTGKMQESVIKEKEEAQGSVGAKKMTEGKEEPGQNENAEQKENTEQIENTEEKENTGERKNAEEKGGEKVPEKIRYTITHIYGKILQIKENLSEYLEIWQAAQTQAAFAKCKKELLHLLYHIRPKKLKAEILFGMEDPALTGEILGVFSIFYPYLGENVFIQPDFEHTVLKGKVSLKGRLRMGTLLLTGARLYFDQNIKGLIRRFRKEKTDGRK